MTGISLAEAKQSQRAWSERQRLLLDWIDGASAERPSGAPRYPSASVLCELAQALAELSRSDRRRTTVRVRIGEEPCELGLERAGGLLLVSLFSGGALPVVHVFERRVVADELSQRVAAELALRKEGAGPRECERIEAAELMLEGATFPGSLMDDVISPEPTSIDAPDDEPFALSGEIALRPAGSQSGSGAGAPQSGSVLRADLFSLLGRGKLRVTAAPHTRELGDLHVFLVAEQLARFALDALEAHGAMRPLWRKVQIGGATVGVRLLGRGNLERRPGGRAAVPGGPPGWSSTDNIERRPGGRAAVPGGPPGWSSSDNIDGERIALTLGRAGPGRHDTWTFPSIEVGVFARAVVDFGRGLCRALVRSDRAQTHNLRLVDFRSTLREIAETCRDARENDAVINASPESYRAYAKLRESVAPSAPPTGRIRFSPKWTAAIPAIDLRSTFLAGDAFVVGNARELCSIDRTSGTISWTRPVNKGVSVLTPCGIARFDLDGELTVIDMSSGETRTRLKLVPRVGGPVTGAVVSGPGLPRMLVLSEGRKNLVGVDLDTGEILWRYAARRAGAFRLKRAGRIVIVASGEQTLTAIDVVAGSVVWRFPDRLRFSQLPTVAGDSLYAIAGDGALGVPGGVRLCHLDPWSGAARWSAPLPDGARPIGPPLVAHDTVVIPSLGRRGMQVAAFDAHTGERRYHREVSAGAAAALVVDDVVVLNSDAGELVAIGARDGALRYRHVFSEGPEGDRPRRLDPVLRSGALFVPQSIVHVVRPSDGQLIGSITTDLIPDLLRVDERCDVYVAEESGYVAAFSAAARLSVVK
ncbi:MAG: PQQ-binding-like beta-propeller repeat protein [Polyangiaceae bacterium]